MLIFVMGSNKLLNLYGEVSYILLDVQMLKTPAANPQRNLPIRRVGIVKINEIPVPMKMIAFIAKIALLRPNFTILPPKRLPMNSPTILEFEMRVM